MGTRPLKARPALVAYAILIFTAFLWVLDHFGRYEALVGLLRVASYLITSGWIYPILTLFSFALIALSFYNDSRRKKALPFTLALVEVENRLIARDGVGFTISGVGDRAVIVWFENQSKYKLQKVRALLSFAASRDKTISYMGLWLDESWVDVQFRPKERKGLILILERDGNWVALSERRENEKHKYMPEFLPIGDETRTIHATLSIEGTAGDRQPRFQIRMNPQLEVLTFWH